MIPFMFSIFILDIIFSRVSVSPLKMRVNQVLLYLTLKVSVHTIKYNICFMAVNAAISHV